MEELLIEALSHSKRIKVLRFQPAEDLQTVDEEFGQFDWRAFVEGQFGSDNQPISNSLQTTLNIDQVRNDRNVVDFGLRKNTQYGGTLELSESLGTRDANSGLLIPPDQGTASVQITFSQELLRNGGRDVVLSRALIARLVANQTHSGVQAAISDTLRDVLNGYWALYQARGNYFIQQSLIVWAEDTLRTLEAFKEIDAQRNSIEQARALLLEARADLANSRAAVMIAQDELYRLVNSSIIDSDSIEIITAESPSESLGHLSVMQELQVALANRAEITQSLSQIRQAALEHHVSLNQLLPQLTLTLETSLSGLDGDDDFFGAKSNLDEINPSYQANINFEYFIGNTAAKARNKRAQLAMRRLHFQYEDQIEEVRLDVSRAIRTLNASVEILNQRRETLLAREKEIDFLRLRRDIIPQRGASTSLLLEQIFQAINRLVDSQQAYVGALSDQQNAMAELLRSKGLLISSGEVPRNLAIGVPSPKRALQKQLQSKDGIIRDAQRRVVEPSRRRW